METSTSRSTNETPSDLDEGKLAPVISRIDKAHPLSEGGPVATPLEEGQRPLMMGDAGLELDLDDASPAMASIESMEGFTEGTNEDDRAAEVFASLDTHSDHTEQLRTQALQLADHLRAKQRELDRREALLNSREAKLDNEMRLARLWARERDQDVAERERQFNQQQQTLEAKMSELAVVEASVDRDLAAQQAELALREQALLQQQHQLLQTQQSIAQERTALRTAEARLEQQRARLAAEQQLAQQKLAARQVEAQAMLDKQFRNLAQAEQALTRREEELSKQRLQLIGNRDREAWETRLAARQTALDQAETLLATHAADLDAARSQLAADREKMQDEAREQRRELAHWQQQERASLAARKEQLDIASGVLDKHRTAVEQLRADAARMHREAIEMRLVSEQLWLELSRHTPPVELTQSVSALRKRLAENYRGAKEHVAEQKAELLRLAERVDEQQRQIVASRQQLQAWLAIQQQELETQASRLVQRELELDKQQTDLAAQRNLWANERRDLQQELRRRLARIRQLEAVSAS